MAETSSIEWTDATWQPITGCAIVSPGCANCYAMKLAGTRLRNLPSRAGLTVGTKAGPVWNGKVRLNEEWLTQPLQWRRPRKIFVCAHGDLFAESVPDAWIDRVFAVMALCPQHTFQVLTKRPERMRAYCKDHDAGEAIDVSTRIDHAMAQMLPSGSDPSSPWPLPNVWLGVSAEDQRRADERVPDLLATPAAVRFVSAEPLLGPIDFRALKPGPKEISLDALTGAFSAAASFGGGLANYQAGLDALPPLPSRRPGLDWLIVGGESGPGARPMHPDWARQIRDACAAAGVAFHFKQHGAWAVALDRDVQDPDWRADYRLALSDDRPGIAWLNRDGGRGFHGARFHVMRRVGKAAAGRRLDGVTHDAFPASPVDHPL